MLSHVAWSMPARQAACQESWPELKLLLITLIIAFHGWSSWFSVRPLISGCIRFCLEVQGPFPLVSWIFSMG